MPCRGHMNEQVIHASQQSKTARRCVMCAARSLRVKRPFTSGRDALEGLVEVEQSAISSRVDQGSGFTRFFGWQKGDALALAERTRSLFVRIQFKVALRHPVRMLAL